MLTDPVRERVLYPALEAIRDKYRHQGGVKVVVQTTGDLLTDKIPDELLSRDVWTVSAAGIDDYHVGMQGDKKYEWAAHLTNMFEAAGMISVADPDECRDWERGGPPVYSLLRATDDAWIGKIWPRGRAWRNNLSKATLKDNFCNAWSVGQCLDACHTTPPDGSDDSNICIGCDAFFKNHLEGVLADLHKQRLKKRLSLIPARQSS